MAERQDPLLSYSFAREHGVVVLDMGAVAQVAVLAPPRPASLLEVRRALGVPLVIETLTPAAFDRRVSDIYAVGAIEADALDGEFNGENSLDTLVQGIPKAADLLEANDEAPENVRGTLEPEEPKDEKRSGKKGTRETVGPETTQSRGNPSHLNPSDYTGNNYLDDMDNNSMFNASQSVIDTQRQAEE